MGKGFSVESIPPAEVPYLFIFATGTGIGPIKALIEAHALQVCFRPCPIRRQHSMCLFFAVPNHCSMDGSTLLFVAFDNVGAL